MTHIAGIIYHKEIDCQKAIDKAWEEIKKGYVPPNTKKPEPLPHPILKKWAHVLNRESFYYNTIVSTFTPDQMDIITNLGAEWVQDES